MKPSSKWIKLIFISLLSLILLSIILIVNSYFNMEKRVNQSAEDYLKKNNDYVISILEKGIDSYSILFNEQAVDIAIALDIENKNQSVLSSISKASNGEIEGIYLLDDTGNAINSVSFSDKNSDELKLNYLSNDHSLKKFLQKKSLKNGKEYYLNNAYYINLYAYNYKNNLFLIVPINLQKLYKNRIINGNSLYRGYSNIKNEDMVIVMHPSNKQINLNFITDRKKLYPNYNFEGLEKVEKMQKTQNEGTIYYNSYWWDQLIPIKAEKLSVFKWINIGDSNWVVSTNLDIEERKALPIENTFLFLILFFIIILVFILFLYFFKQYQDQYSVYLKYKESEKIREEEQLRHELEKKIQQESKLETIGIVSATIAHDLNNILTPLLGMTKLMMEDFKDDEELFSDLETIYSSAKKGQELSGNILRFSSIDNNQESNISIEEVIREGIKIIRPLIPKNVELVLQIETNGKTNVTIDPQDLQNILFNLITNSYQAIGNKKGTITISVLNDIVKERTPYLLHLKGKKVLIIHVIDDGPGIPETIRDKVLNTPFYTTKSKIGGTGLGLFVVTSLAKKYSWNVVLSSSEKGATFTILIPI